MAIEIRELIIRTNIVDDSRIGAGRMQTDSKQPDEKVIVDRCVEKVLRKLNKRKDR